MLIWPPGLASAGLMVKPKHDLARVKELVDECSFSHHHKSVEAVISAKRRNNQALGPTEAEAWIRENLKLLEEADYCDRAILWDDVRLIADVYGKEIDGDCWYIKFWIDDVGELDSISFHPAEWVMVLQTGAIIQKGSLVYDNIKKMWCLRK